MGLRCPFFLTFYHKVPASFRQGAIIKILAVFKFSFLGVSLFMAETILDEKVFQRFYKVLKSKTFNHLDRVASESVLLLDQIRREEWETVVFNSHKLKSSAGQIGAKALSSCITDVESVLLRQSDPHLGPQNQDPAQWQGLVNELSSTIAKTEEALNEVRARIQG